ncbi:carbohydrate ABC transporter permease [Nocardioides sp.]|uniref:carbohydrate ABC transporter permease n=1 Tax=Nocardioides sp. TaxID=35761 RepID=UPI00352934A4
MTSLTGPSTDEQPGRLRRAPRLAATRGGNPLARAALYAVLCILSVIAVLPFLWMVFGAFKSGQEIRTFPPDLLPRDWTLDNFRTILSDPEMPLLTFYKNSLFVAVANVVIQLFLASLLGYIFAKYDFRWRQPLFWYLLALMMVPPSVLMIPNYLILSELGLLNNLWGLVVTAAINPFAIFVMRQFISTLPNDQIESARIDGASEWRIYRSVVLPQVRPALATLALLEFMFNWNAYLWPLIVLTENDKRTLPVILTWYSTQHGAQLNLVMAASVLLVIPVLIFFLLTQRWIVAGLTLTGGK